MLINDVNISEYGAELIDRIASTQVINSITDWLDGSVEGTLLRQSYDFKSIRVTFVVTADNEDTAYKNISKLTEALKKCSIKFDDIDLVFPCFLNGNSIPERLQNGVFKITYVLANDWGLGDEISLEYEITPVNAQKLEVVYIENWASTASVYAQCFDDSELYVTIADETVYIDNDAVAAAAASSSTWTSFFLALGVDVNKYKPATNNTLNGFVYSDTEYSEAEAVALVSTAARIEVYYNRFQKAGLPDLPTDTTYPSLVWSMNDNTSSIYIDLGIGKDWDVRDITVYAWGRWFDPSGDGTMIGAGSDYYCLGLNMPYAEYKTGDVNSHTATVYTDTTSGSQIIIQTLEDIDDTPLRKYGFKRSEDNAAPIRGYVDVLFNGVTLDRTDLTDFTLSNNITLMYGQLGYASYCDISRVQVYYQGELVRDFVPIAGNVKNGFVNEYDGGFYDTITMTFVPWVKSNGTTGAAPAQGVMSYPGTGGSVTPTPDPEPTDPEVTYYTVTVNNGSGSGSYAEGDSVIISANSAEDGYEFVDWTVDTNNVTLTNSTSASTGFIMPAADVTVTANYQATSSGDTGEVGTILVYENDSDITSETVMGENAGTWAQSTSSSAEGLPGGYEQMTAVYSIPNVAGTWSMYNSSNFSLTSTGIYNDKWGRPAMSLYVDASNKSGQYVIFTPDDGRGATQQNFCIKAF